VVEPYVHLAYAPRGAGVLCALFWFVAEDHVYGWFTGAKAHEHPASYFMLEHYYSTRPTVCYCSAQDDPYGDWLIASSGGKSRTARRVPVSMELCRELGRMQDAFVREWLFFEGTPEFEAQAAALRARELPALAMNIRPSKLGKLVTGQPVWTFSSPGADAHIVRFLGERWPLDYQPD
jgi:hypothetical protein